MSEFRSYTCWDPQTIRQTIFSDVGAIDLEDDALFLSTHVSLPVEQWKPSRGIVDENAIRHAMVEAIEAADSKNLVIAITGPSGSGKSHLVRWLRAQLDFSDRRLEVVYIPRRVTSLREITHVLLSQLGGSLAKELEVDLERAVASIGSVALAETLLNRVWEVLKFRPPPGDAQYVRQLLPLLKETDPKMGRGGLAFLLGMDKVRAHLLRTDGVLSKLADSVLGARGGGDTEKPSFTAAEIELGRLSGIRVDLPDHAATALNILNREAGRVAAAALLNAVRDTAIQEVLGMRQGRGLREVFADARIRLQGRQLVLMFEDLALMDFVEGAILDEFANHGDGEHAPLRVVFAITDDKYATLEETIEGRVTHRFWIGEVPLHNPSNPAEIHRRNEFFARYLNAARVGRDPLVAARGANVPVPNQCTDCVLRPDCFRAFGEVDTDIGPIGLYPYNERALAHGITKQSDERHQKNKVLTPRNVIEELIFFFLIRAYQDLEAESMPSERLVEVLRDGSVRRSPRDLVPEFEEGTEELNRLFGVRGYWFDGGQETAAVAEAFALPSIDSPPPPPPPPPPPHPPNGQPRHLPAAVSAVLDWEQGSDLDPRVSSDLRGLLRSLTEQRLDLDRYLLHSGSPVVKELLKGALGDGSFDIKGAPGSKSSKQVPIVVPRSNAGSRLLIAALWISDHGHWIFDDPNRKWDLPGTRDPHNLPVELETFLDDSAAKVEEAVMSSVFAAGEDPVQIAVHLNLMALAAGQGSDGLVPQAWKPVVAEALQAVSSSVSDVIVSALAAARQSPTANPAAVDTVRTAQRSVEHLPAPAENLRDHFPTLAQRWFALRQVVDTAVAPTTQELVQAVDTLGNVLGTDTLADVGEAAVVAGRMANNERAFPSKVSLVDFEDAAKRLRDASLNGEWWRAFAEASRSSGPDLRRVLDAIPHAGVLLQVVEDLRLIHETLTATRKVLDERLVKETGGRSLDGERQSVISARDTLIEAVLAAAEQAGGR